MNRVDLALGIAIAAAVLGVLLAAVAIRQWLTLRTIRRNQRLVVGTDTHDLVEYAVGLLARVEATELRAGEVERLVAAVNGRLDGCYQHSALVRYDALEDSGGKQSASVALLDEAGSGLVLSAIQGRDYARIYVKQVGREGSDLELSPEEQAAVAEARRGV
jgi:hypothetical protein